MLGLAFVLKLVFELGVLRLSLIHSLWCFVIAPATLRCLVAGEQLGCRIAGFDAASCSSCKRPGGQQ